MKNQTNEVIVSLSDLSMDIWGFLEQYNRRPTHELVEIILNALLNDLLYSDSYSDRGYLDHSLEVFQQLNFNNRFSIDYLTKLEAELLLIINSTRINENMDYLDHLGYELLGNHLVKFVYLKPQKTTTATI